jgi:hypothetical protein
LRVRFPSPAPIKSRGYRNNAIAPWPFFLPNFYQSRRLSLFNVLQHGTTHHNNGVVEKFFFAASLAESGSKKPDSAFFLPFFLPASRYFFYHFFYHYDFTCTVSWRWFDFHFGEGIL